MTEEDIGCMGIGTSREDELSGGEYVMKLARSSKGRVSLAPSQLVKLRYMHTLSGCIVHFLFSGSLWHKCRHGVKTELQFSGQ